MNIKVVNIGEIINLYISQLKNLQRRGLFQLSQDRGFLDSLLKKNSARCARKSQLATTDSTHYQYTYQYARNLICFYFLLLFSHTKNINALLLDCSGKTTILLNPDCKTPKI